MSPLSASDPNVLLQRRDDPREPEQVGHLEGVRRGARERRRPAWVLLQVRQCVALQQTDEYFGDDAAADRAQLLSIFLHVGLAKYVEPERCAVVQVERLEIV